MKLIRLYEGKGGRPDICMDVELFIRILEWAREDANADVPLHIVAENAERLTAEYGELSMEAYEKLIAGAGGGDEEEAEIEINP